MSEVEQSYIEINVTLPEQLVAPLNLQNATNIKLGEINNSLSYPIFALIGNYGGSFHTLRQQLTEKYTSLPLVSIAQVDDRQDFISAGGRAIVNPNIVQLPVGTKIVSRLHAPEEQSVNLSAIYSDSLTQYKSIKITSVLGVGYYADIVAYDAYTAGFDPVALRALITNLTTYFGYLVQAGLARFPLDVEYGFSDKEFLMQFSVPVQHFVSEYIFESFTQSPSAAYPFKSLLAQSLNMVDLLDICYLKKGEKLLLSALWQKTDISLSDRFPSLCISEVDSFKAKGFEIQKMIANPQLALSQLQEKMNEAAKQVTLPGPFKPLTSDENVFKRNPLLLGRLVRYITQIRTLDDPALSLEKLLPADIDSYLAEYPNQRLVEKLTIDDKMAIINSLLDPKELKDIETRIVGVTQHIVEENQLVKGSKEEEDLFKQVLKSLDDIDNSDINEWVRGSLLETDENTLVKGRYDEDDSVSKIKGTTDVIKDEVWRVKGDGVKEDLRQAVMRVKSLGGSATDLKKELAKTLTHGLEIADISSENAGENLMTAAISRFAIGKSVDSAKSDDNSVDADSFKVKKLLEELTYKNDLLEKYRKMISALKVENDSAKSTDLVVKSMEGSEIGSAVDKVISDLRIAERNIKSRDQAIENLKQKIKRYELQDKNVKTIVTDGSASKNSDQMQKDHQKAKAQQQATQALLEISNKKIATLTQELHEANQQAKGHDSVGMARLKDSLKNAQNRLVTLMREKTELQTLMKKMQVDAQQVQNLQESNDRLKLNNNKRDEMKTIEQGKLLEKIKLDLNGMNEKHREALTTISEQNRQIKALELQLKNATSLEKKNEAKFSTVASEEDKNAYKVKQLETVNERLEEASKKALADLNEKKKEMMQMKSENTMLKNKLQALERKVVKR